MKVPAPTESQPLRVLLVENNRAEGQRVREAVSEATGPCHLERVGRLAEAKSRLANGGFDLILADVALPDRHGAETVHQLRRCAPDTPIVVLASSEDGQAAAAPRAEGAPDCAGKGTGEAARPECVPRSDIRQQRHQQLLQKLRKQLQQIRRVLESKRQELVQKTSDLEQSEGRYRELLRAVTSYRYSVVVQDDKGVLTTHSDRCVATTGYTPEEYAADPQLWISMVHPDDQERVLGQVGALLAGEAVEPIEHRIVRKDGEIRWVRRSLVPRYEDGRLVSYDGLVKDVTERKDAEEQLKRQNDLLMACNRVFEEALTCGAVAEVAQVSLAVVQELTGSPLGFVGQLNEAGRFDTLAVSMPQAGSWCPAPSNGGDPIRNMEIRGIWGLVFKEERSVIVNDPASHPARVGTPEGHPAIHCFLGIPLRQGNQIVGMIGLANKEDGYHASDQEAGELVSAAIVEAMMHKRTQMALRSQQALLQTVLDSAEAGIVACDADGRLTVFNQAAKAFHGRGDDDSPPAGWPHGCGLRRADGQREITKDEFPLFQALAGHSVHDVEMAIRSGSGPVRTVVACARPLPSQSGQRGGAVMVMHDISGRREAEKALWEKEEELRQIQKLESIGSLAGGIAHEFNNLLQAIIGHTQFAIQELPPDEPARCDLERVLASADRAKDLTRQLLGFSRRQVLKPELIAVNDVIAELGRMLRSLIPEHIQLQIRLGETAGVVHADPGAIQQVILNLCVNARDAMPFGGRLSLETRRTTLDETFCRAHAGVRPGTYTLLQVSDTGSGMAPEVKERIFEPFFTTKEVGKGTGLGLATVYGIVQQHGGIIHVESEPGHGSTFTVYLPAAQEGTRPEVPAQTTPAPGDGETILVAEDELTVRTLTTRILENAGYTVLAASDGQEALEVFRRHRDRIALAILDAIMPGRNGHEVYQQLKEDRPDLKVIFSTGYDPETARSGFIARENLHLIQKPFSPKALLRLVRGVLDADDANAAASPPRKSPPGKNPPPGR